MNATTTLREAKLRQLASRPLEFATAPLVERTHKPAPSQDLSVTDMLKLFERKEALELTYVPHFLTQCVVYYTELLVKYAIDNRIEEMKHNTRALRAVCTEYHDALRTEMPSHVYKRFLEQRDEYLDDCGINLHLMYFTFANDVLKASGKYPHYELQTYAHMILAIIEFVENYDRKVNREIAERLGRSCRNNRDARLYAIKEVCQRIVKDRPIERSKSIDVALNVIYNKALGMVQKMI